MFRFSENLSHWTVTEECWVSQKQEPKLQANKKASKQQQQQKLLFVMSYWRAKNKQKVKTGHLTSRFTFFCCFCEEYIYFCSKKKKKKKKKKERKNGKTWPHPRKNYTPPTPLVLFPIKIVYFQPFVYFNMYFAERTHSASFALFFSAKDRWLHQPLVCCGHWFVH